ncbi:MAG: ATP-binding cassette domain-containing protein [Acidobacteria bacterium]|nr:ATP-binding cassette domain-containing protein [Acidobacteriota bacterium]
MTILGFEINGPLIILGLITGMTYGILGVGLVFIYRSSRIVNFAHGQVGAFGAALLSLAVVGWGVPYWFAFPGAVIASAGMGALAETAAIRRLRKAPRLMSIVATLGIAQFLGVFAFVINAQARAGTVFPQPPGLPRFEVGALLVTPAYSGMLFLSPVLVLGLWLFLRRSRLGLAIRGAADNPDAARLAGVPTDRMSWVAWAIAGALSCFTAVLILPTQGFAAGDTFGPTLLLRALVPAVIARMSSLPVALLAGLGVGVIEQEVIWNYPRGGVPNLVLFVVILIGLLSQRRRGARETERGTWLALRPWPPLPEAWERVWVIRHRGLVMAASGLLIAVALAGLVTNSSAIILATIVSFGLVGLSVGVITGLGGQVSFGQFGLAAIGAVASFWVVARTGNFMFAFLAAGLAAAVGSVLIGLPALRIPGLMLAVTTLGFALVSSTWLLRQSWMLGDGVQPGRPIIGGFAFDSGRSYYLFALGVFVAGSLLARNIWRSSLGRELIAVRDNEDTARAFGVLATRVKLQAFALAGFLAGLGGAVFGHALSTLRPGAFPTGASISVVAMAALGGIGWIAGPLMGALYIIGIPQFVPLDTAGLAATSFGWLLLVLYAPGGLAQLVRPVRAAVLRWVAARAGVRAEERPAAGATTSVVTRTGARARTTPTGGVLLAASGLRKTYGGVLAVDGLSLAVQAGEIVGLIGPNGAGKTTAFDLISGFARADAGSVVFAGHDVTTFGPEARSRRGMIRSFQDAALFPTMTVVEAIALASHRIGGGGGFIRAVSGLRGGDRLALTRAAALIDAMGLGGYRRATISELSTGTRRIVEIACMVALEPAMLLLDEPSAGIAQRETEALGELLARVRRDLDTTMLLIEHDIPLIMGLAGRILAMESGRLIAQGTPAEIRANPDVIRSYLGGDLAAIERSDARIVAKARRG